MGVGMGKFRDIQAQAGLRTSQTGVGISSLSIPVCVTLGVCLALSEPLGLLGYSYILLGLFWGLNHITHCLTTLGLP